MSKHNYNHILRFLKNFSNRLVSKSCKNSCLTIFALSLNVVILGFNLQTPPTLNAQNVKTEQVNSEKIKILDKNIENYLNAIRTRTTSEKKQEIDFLIKTCKDSLVRQHTALKIYAYYMTSKIMGDDALPVYITDNWFIPGKIKMRNDTELIMAKIYAEFNRKSLIGETAPALDLCLPDNSPIDILSEEKYKVLYFYEIGCPECAVQSPLLAKIIKKHDWPANIYLIFTGANYKEWEKYRHKNFNFPDNMHIYNCYNPYMNMDFQKDYGVMKVPMLYLIDRNNKIIGRNLDPLVLEQMLDDRIVAEQQSQNGSEIELDYGSDKAGEFYNAIFADTLNICEVASYIKKSTYDTGNVVQYRQMAGDMLYWLSSRRETQVKKQEIEFIDKFILDVPVWKTKDDTLKVVELATMMKELLTKSPIGSTVPDLSLWGKMTNLQNIKKFSTIENCKEGRYNIKKHGNGDLLLFLYTENCGSCKQISSSLINLFSPEYTKDRNNLAQQFYNASNRKLRKTKVLFVNIDDILVQFPAEAKILFDSFDLSSLPYITLINKKGEVVDKYISF